MFDRKFLQNQEMGRWKSDAFENEELANKIFYDVKKYLKTMPHPFCSWRSIPNQKLSTIEINENGLRSPSLKNIKDSNNCMLLGGSVAWGFGSSSNQYIPSYLIEKHLRNEFKKEINVINFAQNAFNSNDEIRSFMSYVDEIKPKIVIILSGVNDMFHLKHDSNKITDQHKKTLDFFLWGSKYGIIEKQSFLKKITKFLVRFGKKIYKPDNRFYEFYKYEKKNIPINLYSHKTDIINSYCALKGIKVVHVLQPLLIYKKNKSSYENNYLTHWNKDFQNYYYNVDNIDNHYKDLKKNFFNDSSNNKDCIFIDSTTFFDDNEETIFFDLCHISDRGYKILSKKIFEAINEKFKDKLNFL